VQFNSEHLRCFRSYSRSPFDGATGLFWANTTRFSAANSDFQLTGSHERKVCYLSELLETKEEQ
ncbi:hypothetical protein JOQ06_024071, partial [Pogonophryne albipinna]